MPLGEYIFLCVYFSILGLLCLYGVHRFHIAWLYLKHRESRPRKIELSTWPVVTIQLPLFNEKNVAQRLIDSVCQLDYPKDRLEIQVLDDSTDNTVEVSRLAVAKWAEKGIDITHIHRTNRQGFKAGALEEGLVVAKGDFVAVFDADFIPPAAFLKQMMGYFSHDNIGMVQARWGHLNRDYSLLTKVQSILLDGHFMIEHTARHRSGRFFNFNGTAGIWRKSCIASAGGWHHDTLTEDLDLSYRAQLKGWKFVFVNDVIAPAELPIEMNAFKAQQHRWAKGSIQVGLKILPVILRSKQPMKVKIESMIHLTSNLSYILMLIMSLMMPFALRIRVEHGLYEVLLLDFPCFLGATISVAAFYMLSQREVGRPWTVIFHVPAVLGIGIGLAINNSKAVLEALLGHDSPFVRTPKLAVEDGSGERVKPKTYRAKRNLLPIFELGFGCLYTYSVVYCLSETIWLATPFMMLFQWGFLYVAFMGLFQWSNVRAFKKRARA
ncbi:MAG: cellulose synthase family protein [Myxococcota bacterium]|nr:cellulose synthase family protein [Myxococcota bacterium]